MYIAPNPGEYHKKYFDLVKEVQSAAPRTAFFILAINEKIIEGSYYKAMREARELIKFEEELVSHAKSQPAA
jgi:flagellar protein FlbT